MNDHMSSIAEQRKHYTKKIDLPLYRPRCECNCEAYIYFFAFFVQSKKEKPISCFTNKNDCNSSEKNALSLQSLSTAKYVLYILRVHKINLAACIYKITAKPTNGSHLVSMYSSHLIIACAHYCTPCDQLQQGNWWTNLKLHVLDIFSKMQTHPFQVRLLKVKHQ